MELVITEIQGGVDRFEWLEVNVDFLLFPFLCDYGTTVDNLNHNRLSSLPDNIYLETHQAVGWHLGVELQSMLYRGDRPQHRQPVDPGLDVGRRPVLVSQHLGDPGDLVTWRDDQGDHAGPIASCSLQGFDQFLHFPDFNIFVRVFC